MNSPEERRLVTILFADLSGFTAFAQNLDPEDIREALGICFELLNRIITKHGGTIHKYEGDLVIAVFGLPQAHEDDPERAIKASLAMIESVPEINSTLTTRLRVTWDLGLHMGISIGTVFVGEIGSAEKKEYTIIGEEVNLAARLKEAARRGEVLVSARVFRLTRYLFEYEPLPSITLKGFTEPFRVFRPLRIKQVPEPKRGVQGLHSPMVGRGREFQILSAKLENLPQASSGGVILVSGDAGMGKTRLADELKHLIADRGLPLTVLEGSCLSYGETLAYFPFIRILAQFFGLGDQDSAPAVQEKLVGRIKAMFPDTYREIAPYIGFLFSSSIAPELAEKIRYLDPSNLKIQIAVAVRSLLVTAARTRPIFLAIEDYHWIDSSSLALLEFVAAVTETVPLLIMCLSRPEKESEGSHLTERLAKKLGDRFTRISLGPLDAETSRQLASNLLLVSGLSGPDRDHVLAKAEGNPFYLEEILRSLIDRGYLTYETGVWKATARLSISDIPDTIHGLIASRLDQLSPDVRQVLHKAAVIGRSFYVRVLERLTGSDSLMLSLNLATLEEFEYINRSTKEPEPEYAFKHPLLQEVVYSGLLRRDRTALHRGVAEIVEELFQHRLEEFTDILAYHYALGDNVDQAVKWLKKAGFKAKMRHAHDEAIMFFQKLIGIIGDVQSKTAPQLLAQNEAHEALGDIFERKGEYAEAIRFYDLMHQASRDGIGRATAQRKKAQAYVNQSAYDEALEALGQAETTLQEDSLESALEHAEIERLRSTVHLIVGLQDTALKEAQKALTSLGELKSDVRVNNVKARCLTQLGSILRAQGRYAEAITTYEKSKELLEELDDKQAIAALYNHLGVIYHLTGDYRGAIELNEQALAILEEIGDKLGIGRICGNLGIFYSYIDNLDKALEFHQKNLILAQEIGDKRGAGMSHNNLGRVYLSQGRFDQSRQHFQETIEIAVEIGDKATASAAYGNLGILFLRTGELDAAEEKLLETERILKQLGNRELLVVTYTQLAEVHLTKGASLKRALEYANQGYALAKELGSKPSQADSCSVLAWIYAAMSQFSTAEENLESAAMLFAEIGRKNAIVRVFQKYARVLSSVGQTEGANRYEERARVLENELKNPA